MPETQEESHIEKLAGTEIEVKTPTPFLDACNKSLIKIFDKELPQIIDNQNRAIARGVATDDTARDGDGVCQEGRKAIRVVNEIRLYYTRPVDAWKTDFINDCRRELKPLVDSNKILDELLMERAAEIQAKQEEARRKAEEEKWAIEEAARKEEERRRNISLAKGGNGDVAPVVPEIPIQPYEQIGMRSTTRTKSIVDNCAIQQAVQHDGIREIPGVSIYQVWTFEVLDAKKVPKEYRRTIRG